MEASVTAPVFLNAAEELLHRLDGDQDPNAALLASDALKLVSTFRGWESVRPEPNERAEAVNSLIELNRRVLIYISKKTRA
jgi:hypothetical protein